MRPLQDKDKCACVCGLLLHTCVCPCRQLDCLRYLLTLLMDKRQGQVLCGLSFRQLEPDAGQLLEMRARGADLLTQNTYPTLYSFYILRKNYRKGDSPRMLLVAHRVPQVCVAPQELQPCLNGLAALARSCRVCQPSVGRQPVWLWS